ncbi:MAG TPA: FkbM family methyltransferase [Candidatus Binatia bacterium]|jgi:FkbM family methyltransferase
MNRTLLVLGNRLYRHAYPFYRPLYVLYKALLDRRERAFLRRVLIPGMTVVDIGANIGVYSRFFARLVGADGKVVAFEPAADVFRRLRHNVAGLSQVEPIHAAIGSFTGEIVLFESDELNVDHRVYDTGENRRQTRVRCWALDDYIQPTQRIDLVKIDVQGFELRALRGAERVLQSNAGIVVLLEFWPHGLRAAGDQPTALVDYLSKECGFQLYGIESRRLRLFDPRSLNDHPESYCNVLALRAPVPSALQDMLR